MLHRTPPGQAISMLAPAGPMLASATPPIRRNAFAVSMRARRVSPNRATACPQRVVAAAWIASKVATSEAARGATTPIVVPGERSRVPPTIASTTRRIAVGAGRTTTKLHVRIPSPAATSPPVAPSSASWHSGVSANRPFPSISSTRAVSACVGTAIDTVTVSAIPASSVPGLTAGGPRPQALESALSTTLSRGWPSVKRMPSTRPNRTMPGMVASGPRLLIRRSIRVLVVIIGRGQRPVAETAGRKR